MTKNAKATLLADYAPPAYLLESTELTFDFSKEFSEKVVRVSNRMRIKPNPDSSKKELPLSLNGKSLRLIGIERNGQKLEEKDYGFEEETLILPGSSTPFEILIETEICPTENRSCEGLYCSSGIYCTQNESEGFRRITYYPDRPDVLSVFRTKIIADPKKLPILLANGNETERKDRDDGLREIVWEDPFPKPSYLFALVAGNLSLVEDQFTTKSGRDVKLQIFVEPGNEGRCDFAMKSLKHSMKWDEERFGREYDLDRYMIVAVNDFNAGAMENKGLNLFNASYVLANAETATDRDFHNIQAVIGHEYFHNWTGNRVSCRDWFQLSIKEGLTVFREQEFMADTFSRSLERIDQASYIRSVQFLEDAGPMSHPVRPDSYEEISNFYTPTVYEKGSELIRMLQTLLGKEVFRKGMDQYFDRFDGKTVTAEDFVSVMEEASGKDLSQFMNWYRQSGTPVVEFGEGEFSGERFSISVKQSCPPTPGQKTKDPFLIPVHIGLLTEEGREIGEKVFYLHESSQEFEFENVPSRPLLSLMRSFSAPVRVNSPVDFEDRLKLIEMDSDGFNQWDSAYQLYLEVQLDLLSDFGKGRELTLKDPAKKLFHTMGQVLKNDRLDPALIARILIPPSEGALWQEVSAVDVEAIHRVVDFLESQFASRYRNRLLKVYESLLPKDGYEFSPESFGRRSLKNQCLRVLSVLKDSEAITLAAKQFQKSDNMTDSLAALAALADTECPQRESLFSEFYERWKSDSIVINKWFALQALSNRSDLLERVRELSNDPVFNIRNPNRVYSLFRNFSVNNPYGFHQAYQDSYDFLAEKILEIDPKNPSLAARLLGGFQHWKRFLDPQKSAQKDQLERLAAEKALSKNVREIVTKSLA